MKEVSLIKGNSRKLAFIGAGRMAEAIISGLIRGRTLTGADIIAADISQERLTYMHEKYGIAVSTDNRVAARAADVLLLAIKPQHFDGVLPSLSVDLRPEHLLISIAAGVSVRRVRGLIGRDLPVVRVMPNTPALVNAGISAVAVPPGLTSAQKDFVHSILSSVGEVVYVDEADINAVTAVSGSGPAYYFLFVRELARAGTACGLDPALATTLARETFFGSARLSAAGEADEDALIEAVASPGGTTEAALRAFESKGLSEVGAAAVTAAAARAEELDS